MGVAEPMTRINDVARVIEGYLVLADEACVEPDSDRLARGLDAAGHLLPDLPEHDEIAHPGPTKVWDVGEDNFVEYDPRYDTISLSQLFGLEVRLDPDDIPTAVSALLAALHERNQE